MPLRSADAVGRLGLVMGNQHDGHGANDNEDEARTGAHRDELHVAPSGDLGSVNHTTEYLEAFGSGSHTPIINDPNDGLPRPADDYVSAAPPLSVASLVCLEDTSSYVSVFKDEAEDVVRARKPFEPAFGNLTAFVAAAKRVRDGAQERFSDKGAEYPREVFPPARVEVKWGLWMVGNVFVRPVRMRCKHFFRQLDLDKDIVSAGVSPVEPMHSYCKALRSVAGAYYSLTDEAVTACEERSPVDVVGNTRITERVRLKVLQGQERKAAPFVPPVPVKDWLVDTASYDEIAWAVKCDPARLPGKSALLRVVDPSTFFTLAPVMAEGCIVGMEWSPPATVIPGLSPDAQLHTVLVSERDYSDPSLPVEERLEFLNAWPTHASYPYLDTNLHSLPRHLYAALRAGRDVAVTGLDPRDAVFVAALVADLAFFDGALVTSPPDTWLAAHTPRDEHRVYRQRARDLLARASTVPPTTVPPTDPAPAA